MGFKTYLRDLFRSGALTLDQELEEASRGIFHVDFRGTGEEWWGAQCQMILAVGTRIDDVLGGLQGVLRLDAGGLHFEPLDWGIPATMKEALHPPDPVARDLPWSCIEACHVEDWTERHLCFLVFLDPPTGRREWLGVRFTHSEVLLVFVLRLKAAEVQMDVIPGPAM